MDSENGTYFDKLTLIFSSYSPNFNRRLILICYSRNQIK